MQSDPIADMLTRIRNACMVQHKQVVLPSSNMKVSIAKILVEEGFVGAFRTTADKPQAKLVLDLKYTGRGEPVITGIDRVSKPGKRVYTKYQDIPWVRSGLGITVISTSKGVMTGRMARRNRLGGEVICNVW